MKKFYTILFAGALILTGCGNNGGGAGGSKPKVDIKHLSATLNSTPEVNALGRKEAKAATSDLEEAQYIVIYKSETDIDFKVELDNPEYAEITAIKFACEDPAAQIAVQDSKGDTTWNNIHDYPIVKWGGTDMYKRIFEVKLSEDYTSEKCALSVLDLQVNNEWQKKELSNDVLDVYRMNENDLNWKFITNTPEYYEWEIETSENVENVKVYKAYEHSPAFDSEVLPDENGKYRVNSNCRLRYIWKFKVGNTEVEWENSKEIELFNYTVHQGVLDGDPLFGTAGVSTDLRINKINGTGIEKEYVIVLYDENRYQLNRTEYNTYSISSNLLVYKSENREKYIIIIGNSNYMINELNTELVAI